MISCFVSDVQQGPYVKVTEKNTTYTQSETKSKKAKVDRENTNSKADKENDKKKAVDKSKVIKEQKKNQQQAAVEAAKMRGKKIASSK